MPTASSCASSWSRHACRPSVPRKRRSGTGVSFLRTLGEHLRSGRGAVAPARYHRGVRSWQQLRRAVTGARAAAARTRTADLDAKLAAVQRRLEDIAAASAQQGEQLRIAIEVLRTLHDEEAVNRLRLQELRRTPEYELAFDEGDPLVSVVIPTYDRPQLLCERSISSVLAQTYRNFEIVVVG